MINPLVIIDRNIPTIPIKFTGKASVVVQVNRVNGSEDLHEQHLIIQQNFDDVKNWDRLFIVGTVKAYRHDKKSCRFDYCLDVRYYKKLL